MNASRRIRTTLTLCLGNLALSACMASAGAGTPQSSADRWWKGNTHTHTLWSDGDDFPEMVADWYKQNGYNFVALSDHNTLATEEKWWRASPTPLGRETLDKYRARFGPLVQERTQPELRVFEVYNGHPLVFINGDSLHASNERIWDIVLTHRMSRGGELLYGLATDDSHDYHRFGQPQRNTGRGWIMVRAPRLEQNALMAALEAGSFYASNGVVLDDLKFDHRRLSVAIQAAPGVTYTTQFIGTRRGYDSSSTAVTDTAGAPLTRRYSRDEGAVLAEVAGTRATYTMRGDELYVRARVVSSRTKANPSFIGEIETAWIQPVRLVRP